MNKYQEALNDIAIDYQDLLKNWKTSLPKWEYEKTKNQVKENIDTLQELIDNYSKLEKALDKACEQIANRGVIEDICTNRKVKCKYYEQCTNNIDFGCPINHWSSNEWKEYLLKESEEK